MENDMARGVVQCAEPEGGRVYAVAVYRRIVAGYADVADGGLRRCCCCCCSFLLSNFII